MSTYIILGSFTRRGIEKIRESPDRLAAAKKAFRAAGAELKQFYLVTGGFDMIVIAEAPDAETIAKVSLLIGSQGSVRTETLRAFTEEEYQGLIAGLPS
ncbi:GYD domain-containing protein [Chloroflexota bacterium]